MSRAERKDAAFRAACEEEAAEFARQGSSLDDYYDHLDRRCRRRLRSLPDADLLRTAGLAWAEVAAERWRDTSCVDQSTGLDSLAHLAEYLATAFAQGNGLPLPVTLVVLDVHGEVPPDGMRRVHAELLRSPRFLVGAVARPARTVAVAQDHRDLARELELLRVAVAHVLGKESGAIAVWTESLPADERLATATLDELTR